MKISDIIFIILSIIITALILYLYPEIYLAIVAGIPLFRFTQRYAFTIGFLVGIISNFLVLLILYPLSLILKLSNILSLLSGLPAIVLLVFYPILFSIVLALSATIASEIYRRTKRKT